jgi:cytoskeletal protein RodZ
MQNKSIKKGRRSRSKWIILLVLLMIAAVIAVLEITNVTHFFHKAAVVRAPSQPITHISTTTPKTTSGTKTQATNPTLSQGGPTAATQAATDVPTDPSKWSVSASGAITVKLPSSNGTIQSGATLTGTATVAQVQYRLTDNQVGVISAGPVNVVNGSFTAAMNFTSHGSSGRLDVFSTDASGKEYNEVQIPVSF